MISKPPFRVSILWTFNNITWFAYLATSDRPVLLSYPKLSAWSYKNNELSYGKNIAKCYHNLPQTVKINMWQNNIVSHACVLLYITRPKYNATPGLMFARYSGRPSGTAASIFKQERSTTEGCIFQCHLREMCGYAVMQDASYGSNNLCTKVMEDACSRFQYPKLGMISMISLSAKQKWPSFGKWRL